MPFLTLETNLLSGLHVFAAKTLFHTPPLRNPHLPNFSWTHIQTVIWTSIITLQSRTHEIHGQTKTASRSTVPRSVSPLSLSDEPRWPAFLVDLFFGSFIILGHSSLGYFGRRLTVFLLDNFQLSIPCFFNSLVTLILTLRCLLLLLRLRQQTLNKGWLLFKSVSSSGALPTTTCSCSSVLSFYLCLVCAFSRQTATNSLRCFETPPASSSPLLLHPPKSPTHSHVHADTWCEARVRVSTY